ncbi:uncharacterized protein PAC_09346 [Phialocephala subalpina]|uniref:N-acetyltransferase domain-containing protein n=1 Tax=Phialocephala subalpina TaxID=576137 RepID=A0A1L7X356_9HELO|nr:uncharacterized protein PAC_09346 [Phialocephala subalpina]
MSSTSIRQVREQLEEISYLMERNLDFLSENSSAATTSKQRIRENKGAKTTMSITYDMQDRDQLEEISYPLDENIRNIFRRRQVPAREKTLDNEIKSAVTSASIEQSRDQMEEICYPADEDLKLILKPRKTSTTTTTKNCNDESNNTTTTAATTELSPTPSWTPTPFPTDGLPPTPPMSPEPSPLRPKYEYHIQFDTKLQHWTRNFIVFLIHPFTNRNMGQAQARYLDRAALLSIYKSKKQNPNQRPFCFSKSVELLNDGNSDGLALAQQLFDRDGLLMKRHSMGVWGQELNKGAILILGYLLVKREWRRQGMAGMAIRALIERAKTTKGDVRWMFVKPGTIKEDLELEGKTEGEKEEIEKKAYESAVRFYRSFGFRRVGYSEWFCLAMDEEHASRKTAVEDDLELPEKKDKI